MVQMFPVLLMLFVYIPMFAVSIYCTVLFILLGHRGIKALDIFIKKNTIQDKRE